MQTSEDTQEEQKSQRKSKLEEMALLNAYDPDSFPPDVELAKRHGVLCIFPKEVDRLKDRNRGS